MIELDAIRYLLANTWRNPAAWVVALLTGASWPLFSSLFALGVTTGSRAPVSALLEIGFLAGTLGATMALIALSNGSWWLHRTTPWRRFRLEFTGLAVGSFALITIAWLLPLSMTIQNGSFSLIPMAIQGVLVSFKIAGIGVCILALPTGPLLRAALLPLVAYVLPNLLRGHGRFAQGLQQCFDLVGDFQFSWTAESSSTRLATYLAPIFGLCLLRMAEAIRRATHPCGTQS